MKQTKLEKIAAKLEGKSKERIYEKLLYVHSAGYIDGVENTLDGVDKFTESLRASLLES